MQPKTWLKSFNSFVLNVSYDELGTKNKYKKEKGEGRRKEEGPLASTQSKAHFWTWKRFPHSRLVHALIADAVSSSKSPYSQRIDNSS